MGGGAVKSIHHTLELHKCGSAWEDQGMILRYLIPGGILQTAYVHHLLQHYQLQLRERGSGTDLVPQKSCKSGNERKSYEKRRGEAAGRWWNSH